MVILFVVVFFCTPNAAAVAVVMAWAVFLSLLSQLCLSQQQAVPCPVGLRVYKKRSAVLQTSSLPRRRRPAPPPSRLKIRRNFAKPRKDFSAEKEGSEVQLERVRLSLNQRAQNEVGEICREIGQR